MYVDIRKLVFLGLSLMVSTHSQAEGVSLSIGGGYPFFVVPEVSYITKSNDERWYVNYKAGLDQGFSVGYEFSTSSDKRHALGFVLGTVGINQHSVPCEDTQSDINCIVANLFDEETIQGLGLSYSYYFDELAVSGWHVKLEAGYGNGRVSDDNSTASSIRISYQF